MYGNPGSLFAKQWGMKQLGSLKGLKVLDIACGEGENSVLFALLGADVTGVEISKESVKNAQRRAEVNGVSERVNFICAPFESLDLEEKYDVVNISAFLHHILDNLDFCMKCVVKALKPGGKILIEEPTCASRFMKKLRDLTPIPPNAATPDERPLNQEEINLVKSYLGDIRVGEFGLLSRFTRLILGDTFIEDASKFKKSLVYLIASIDKIIFTIPAARKFSSTQVWFGTARI